jgi:hypothetical protein
VVVAHPGLEPGRMPGRLDPAYQAGVVERLSTCTR